MKDFEFIKFLILILNDVLTHHQLSVLPNLQTDFFHVLNDIFTRWFFSFIRFNMRSFSYQYFLSHSGLLSFSSHYFLSPNLLFAFLSIWPFLQKLKLH